MTKSRRVIAFGTYNIRKHPRIGIIIEGLREHGWQVAEINEPLELTTAQRVDILKNPRKLFGFLFSVLNLWKKLYQRTKHYVNENGTPQVVLVGYMGHFDILLARHLFKKSKIILDHLIFAADTARDRGAQPLKIRLLSHLDSMALNKSDLILVDTQEHQNKLRPRDTSLVVPVGASPEWFKAGLTREHKPRNGIVFYGLYTPLQGTIVIGRALEILHNQGFTIHVDLVGTGQDFEKVQNIVKLLKNVKLIKWIEPELLPSFVAEHQISLGIFSATPKGQRVVPNKVYQSLAAGCAVITSDTPPQRRMLGESATFVNPNDPADLAKAIKSIALNNQGLNQSKEAIQASLRYTPYQVSKELSNWLEGIQ